LPEEVFPEPVFPEDGPGSGWGLFTLITVTRPRQASAAN
jgi:hypothetical protein